MAFTRTRALAGSATAYECRRFSFPGPDGLAESRLLPTTTNSDSFAMTTGWYIEPGSSSFAIGGGGQGISLKLKTFVTGAASGMSCKVCMSLGRYASVVDVAVLFGDPMRLPHSS